MRYRLDSSSSKFTVRAFATGMLSTLGHSPTFAVRKFTGEVEFSQDMRERSSLRLQIEADSLEVMDDIKSKDRQEIESTMNRSVIQSDKYPTITFETRSASVEQLGGSRYKVSLNGSLTLHGVTRDLVIPALLTEMGDMLRAGGEVSVLQTNFGITPVSVAGGTLKVKDELKFAFDIVARKTD